ncbi:MAG: Rrf2 family transcriptional regulator [Acidimicrobiia bacterium]|nr:Rrf2 family transcriptional regulator [Acidimicrobiia bacterium]MBP8180325.1 Rrf2 family transcriptional regulator [Acidimicrobiia bacterium]
MKVSTRGDYATRALVSMALHDPQVPTSVKEIAERTGLPQPYLEQILLAIKGAGLVRSKRGVGGGYVLARPARDISVADVLAAVDGPIASDFDEIEHSEGRCVIQDIWVEVFERMREYLNAVTLADLVDRATVGHVGVHSDEPRSIDPLG